MSLDQVKIPDNVVVEVTGPRDTHKIFLTTLSTCMWCKRGKQWLIDQGYAKTVEINFWGETKISFHCY